MEDPMKNLKSISYGLIVGLAFGGAQISASEKLEENPNKTEQKSLKSKIKKVIKSRSFQVGVGVAIVFGGASTALIVKSRQANKTVCDYVGEGIDDAIKRAILLVFYPCIQMSGWRS